ncbi:class I SAM-dependent methyltransferase [Ruminococcus gauvreauii]|uniref:Methyltransferase domain-containing protein n=1 Tax=Ruminococcus gauvreauii TaxID=438033 RepID=A0ABY5VKI5_9FIRM|nr:class I SAM-dependent methyltransferase [Ruminococcus gauvreauii]UWP60563.1 methyltransferase domain-containing protein [Ruminococcus gauvreauii]
MKNYQITQWCSHFMKEQIRPGDLCIDATAGNGHDTLLLCRLVGETGRVLAFDIQPEALERTRSRLTEHGVAGRAELILDSHSNLSRYAAEGSVSCIVFNLGYLPSGDHTIATHPKSTIAALEAGLLLLQKNGIISLCIYSGKDSGFVERDAVLAYLKALDPKRFIVIMSQYYNRPNHPPIPVLIIKI